MESVKIRSHHLKDFLSWLKMPDYRILSLSTLYNKKQEEFSKEAIESYERGKLKYIEITGGVDDICKRCPSEKRKENCEEEDNIAVLSEKIFNTGKYNIEEIIKYFDKESFYLQLRDKYQ